MVIKSVSKHQDKVKRDDVARTIRRMRLAVKELAKESNRTILLSRVY